MMVEKVCFNKDNVSNKFSLEQVLSEDSAWLKSISQKIWDNHIKASPNWRRLCDLNERVSGLESKISKMDSKLDLILQEIHLNGGRKE